MSYDEFNDVLKPFLDQDILYPQESEYHMSCSIYAPLKHAVERAELPNDEINLCLLVGGSSLIPQVRDAISSYFPRAELLTFDNKDDMYTATSKGAALQALSLALYGRGIFRSMTGDCINIRTKNGVQTLVPEHTETPYPSEGWHEHVGLKIPESSLTEPLKLRIELCNGDDKTLFSGSWRINSIVTQGDPIRLRYRLDANQVLMLELSLDNDPDFEPSMMTIENPLTNVFNPNSKRENILELEEAMRSGNLSKSQQRATVMKIAELEMELGANEKAHSLLQKLIVGEPDEQALFKLGLLAGHIGDYERQERYYGEVIRLNRGYRNSALFNLALSKHKDQGEKDSALRYVNQAAETDKRATLQVLKGTILHDLNQFAERDKCLATAFKKFGTVSKLTDWELAWFGRAARMSDDANHIKAHRDELEYRQSNQTTASEPDALFPAGSTDLAQRPS